MSVVEGRAEIKEFAAESISTGAKHAVKRFGVGGSILWREEDVDRWAWFIRKKFRTKWKKPTLAAMIVEAMPQSGDRDAIATIRRRVMARQRAYEREKKVRIARQRMFDR